MAPKLKSSAIARNSAFGDTTPSPPLASTYSTTSKPHPTIDFYNFATGKISPVLTFDERPARLQPSLSATADGKTLYFTQYDRQSVIKMMEFAP